MKIQRINSTVNGTEVTSTRIKHQPVYKDNWVQLYQGDCRQILPALALREVFCWTDPPFNVGKNYGTGGWNDRLSEADYLRFCEEWIAAVQACCNEIAIYVPNKFYRQIWNMLGNGFYPIILPWRQEGPFRGRNLISQHATILTNAKPKARTHDVWFDVALPGQGFFFRENKFGHPGYTSEHLTRLVLEHLADPSAVILDPCCGTATTLRVAKNLRRHAIGIEYSADYCAIAAARLEPDFLSQEHPATDKRHTLSMPAFLRVKF